MKQQIKIKIKKKKETIEKIKMKRALILEKDFNLGLWFITKEVKVIEETPTAVKIKKFIGTEWLPKRGIGLKVEIIKEIPTITGGTNETSDNR